LAEAGLPRRDYVLVVARIVPENSVDLLLDAVALLRDRPEVVIVGSSNYGNPTTSRLERLASDGIVHWLGHVHDQDLLNELWANAGVYWHGHSVGGTNPALLQALGAGAPTIALDTVFNREVVGADDQLVVGDPASLAALLERVLSSADLASSLRLRGQELIATRYPWADVCAAYEGLLRELSAASTARVSAAHARHPGRRKLRTRPVEVSTESRDPPL
jgi:glycosyltransferase involved in cell wall biosynthesis